MSIRLAVFASGGGSNLQALLDRFQGQPDSAARVVLVISDRSSAGALQRAQAAGVDAVVIKVSGRPADDVARETLAALQSAEVELIVLAGYLRLVPPAVVRQFRQRIVNIHPALLPSFGGKGMYGLRVHQAVLAAGATVSGASVHLVDDRYDEGPIIAQWPVPVLPGDGPEELAARVLRIEHMLLPAAVEALAASLREGLPAPMLGPVAGATSFQLTADQAFDAAALRRALGLD